MSAYIDKKILVAGSTGFVGTRMIPRLLEAGYPVRCLAREAERLNLRPWRKQVEVVEADLLDRNQIKQALEGIHAAYYLVHSMSSGQHYIKNDLAAAHNFGDGARQAGLKQIIYLGGLGVPGRMTRHIQSRQLTGEILRQYGVPVTEFRASVIIGSGSISFEMIRFLTESLPFIPAPVQTNVLGQPIAILDLLAYLLAAIDHTPSFNQVIEIGGSQRLTYTEMLSVYAQERGLKRFRLWLPFFNPALSAWFADRLTPVPYSIARPLMGDLVTDSTVHDEAAAAALFPDVPVSSYRDAVRLALLRADSGSAGDYWTSKLVTRTSLNRANVPTKGEGFLLTYRQVRVTDVPGALKALLSGQAPGDWTVDRQSNPHWIRLKSQRQLPGKLWLEVNIRPWEADSLVSSSLLFEPRGIKGHLFWLARSKSIASDIQRWLDQLIGESRKPGIKNG